MQLFTNSEEFGLTEGLNLIKGNILRLDRFSDKFDSKLPNIRWRNCMIDSGLREFTILKNISNLDEFYFVHSYGLSNYEKELNVIKSKYKNIEFPAIINYENIYGCQFHPEKVDRKVQNYKKFFRVMRKDIVLLTGNELRHKYFASYLYSFRNINLKLVVHELIQN